jgi:hypothetical protein
LNVNERQAAIKAVVDAWVDPGPSPEVHELWKTHLQQPSPEGWPVLAEAVQRLVAVEQEAARGRTRKR